MGVNIERSPTTTLIVPCTNTIGRPSESRVDRCKSPCQRQPSARGTARPSGRAHCRRATTLQREQLSVYFHEGDRSIFPRREHGISALSGPGEKLTLALVGQRSEIVL